MMTEINSNDSFLPVRIGINGFGRIGRAAFKASLERKDVQIVAINHTCPDLNYLIHVLSFDSTYGKSPYAGLMTISDQKTLVVRNREGKIVADVHLFSERNASILDWSVAMVDVVIESTGTMTTSAQASVHMGSKSNKEGETCHPGPGRVIISAPSSDAPTFVFGVNEETFDPKSPSHTVISNASCTTNALAPLVQALDDLFGVEQGMMTTIHASTASQKLLDGYSNKKDWRAGRSAMANIIPSSTGAAKALSKVLPWTAGKLHGISARVPVCDVSMIDLTVQLQRPCDSVQTLVDQLQAYSCRSFKLARVLHVTKKALVSSDFIGRTESCIIDAPACCRLNDCFYKIVAWYDNELAYSTRLLDLAAHVHGASTVNVVIASLSSSLSSSSLPQKLAPAVVSHVPSTAVASC